MPVELKPGTLVDVAIKGVQFAYDHNNEHNPGRFSICADDGRRYTMPPQAAITLPGEDRVAAVLSLLDGMEHEGSIKPYVAATVRTKLGMPPRHWPPQPGDVWDDGLPWDALWFAQEYPAKPDDPDQTRKIGMVCVAGVRSGCTPRGLLESAVELTLVYRRDGGR